MLLFLPLLVLLSENLYASLFIWWGIHWIPIIPVHHVCQWDSPKWHGPPSARMHLQRWRSQRWHRVTAAIHGRSLEIRATKPLITLWAYNPPAAPSEWNAISLLQLKFSTERGRAGSPGTQGTDRKWSCPSSLSFPQCNWGWESWGLRLELEFI